MSLINEALKKAQRLRAEGQAADAPPIPGGSPIAKRKQARSANTMVLIASGALVLVVLSVVITVWLLNRPSPPPAAPVTSTAAPKKAPASAETAAPSIVTPVLTPAPAPSTASTSTAPAAPSTTPVAPSTTATAVTATSTPPPASTGITKPPAVPTPVAAAPSETATPPVTATPTLTPAATTAASTPAAPVKTAPPAVPEPDPRVTAFIEALKVTAFRPSEGKILMNGRMYRVNDLVERTLGVKLVKVESDGLTFADANGFTYVKHF